MKLHFHPAEDMLYVRLREGRYAASEEVAPGVVLDFDAEGRVLAIEFDHASERADVGALEVAGLSKVALTVSEAVAA